MRRLAIAILIGFGLVVAVAWGVTAAVAYALLAGFLALLVSGIAAGGDLVQRISSSRFDDRDRRR